MFELADLLFQSGVLLDNGVHGPQALCQHAVHLLAQLLKAAHHVRVHVHDVAVHLLQDLRLGVLYVSCEITQSVIGCVG